MTKRLAATAAIATVVAMAIAIAICTARRLPEVPPPEPLPDALIVFCFYGTPRTPEAEKIEAYTQELLHETYGPEMREGKLVWLPLDYDDPKNGVYKEDFGLKGPAIVLGDGRKDRPGIARNLQKKCDALLGDKEAFKAYVRDQIDALE